MIIEVSNRQRKYKVNQRLIRHKVEAVLSLCRLKDVELSILIVNNKRIKALNKIYRGINRPTDVLAFPLTLTLSPGGRGKGEGALNFLGDIVISMEKTYSQAKEQGHSLTREFMILLTHGILHLLGYDHERSSEEGKKMRKRENFILSRI